jgi:transposase-like protein
MTDIVTVDKEQARTLTDRIKVAVEGTWLLIQEAYTSRAWAALGYSNWDDYCNAEFGAARLRLPREERQEVVASLRESGLSVRAIASATGAAYNTVLKDVTQIESPTSITGADGKSYTASRPAAATEAELFAGADWVMDDEPADLVEMAGTETITPTVTIRPPEPVAEPSKPKRRPLPEAFAEAALDLAKTSERLGRLREDDRFNRNRDQTHHQMPDLITALENTTALIQAMDLGTTTNEEARRWWAASLHKTSDALRDVADTLNKEQ